jgi:hypothetical protein
VMPQQAERIGSSVRATAEASTGLGPQQAALKCSSSGSGKPAVKSATSRPAGRLPRRGRGSREDHHALRELLGS